MTCQGNYHWSGNTNHGGHVDGNVGGTKTGGCVTSIVRRILDAQKRVTEDGVTQCITSCEQSIEDLLSPSHSSRPTRYTTIPFMLHCKGTCKTFVASGFTSRNNRGGRHQHFHCISSPVFKVKGFVRGDNNCVRLELLTPVYGSAPREEDADSLNMTTKNCGLFEHRAIKNFRATGVCITVDLRCFCGIVCLDPITPTTTR